MTNEQIFRMFLKKHRKYASFKRQLDTEYISPTTARQVAKYAVDNSFIWDESEEGFEYWSEMDSKWTTMCRDLNIRGPINLNEV